MLGSTKCAKKIYNYIFLDICDNSITIFFVSILFIINIFSCHNFFHIMYLNAVTLLTSTAVQLLSYPLKSQDNVLV